MGVDAATELARVRTRLLVGPASTSSFVVPRAAIVNIAPGERAALEEAFANGCTSCTKLPEGRNRCRPLLAKQVQIPAPHYSYPPSLVGKYSP